MDTISEIVRTVIIIVLLASFIEMLLPGREMGGYVRLVMGLFIIIAILNPLVSWWKGERINWEIEAWSFVPDRSETEAAIAQGMELERQNRELALAEYRKRLEKQVESMAKLLPEVESANADIVLERGEQQWGVLKSIELRIKASTENDGDGTKESTKPLVRPVEIGRTGTGSVAEKNSKDKSQLTKAGNISQQVRDFVKNLYGLRDEQIRVIVEK